jgi:hypothetical protein
MFQCAFVGRENGMGCEVREGANGPTGPSICHACISYCEDCEALLEYEPTSQQERMWEQTF